MKKMSIALVIALIVSIMPNTVIFAAPKPIISNSTFNDSLAGWTGTGGTFVLDSAEAVRETGKSYKGTRGTSATTEFRCSNVDMTVGVTYELSFYAKSDTEGMRFQPIRIHGVGGWTYLPTQTLTTSWKKYTVEFTHTEKNTAGAVVDGTGSLFLRILDAGSVWVDEVYIIDPTEVSLDTEAEYTGEVYQPYEYIPESKKVNLKGFSDVSGHWAEDTVTMLKAEGIVSGMGDGTFLPDRNITRAEFLRLLTAGFNLEDNAYCGMYKDVDANAWYAGTIQNAYELGLISPLLTSDGNFRPDTPITREDACILANSYAEYMGIAASRNSDTFADDSHISKYASDSVYSAVKRGIINGFSDRTFRPSLGLTRAEAAQILRNISETDGAFAVYVDGESGDDLSDGTKNAPFKTLERAQWFIRGNNDNMTHNLYVFIKSGELFMESPIELTPEDSGTNGHSVVYTSYGDGKAILSGGKHFSGNWEQDNAELNIYKRYVGADIKTRQMFVNGIRMQRARTTKGFEGQTQINDDKTGYNTQDLYFKNYRNIDDLELVYYEQWTNPRCGVSGLKTNNDGTITLTMDQPCWSYLMNKAHLAVNMPEYFENQYEFLDEPGEWYLDSEGWLYYIPYDFVDLNTADIVLPVTEKLLTVTGSREKRVENVSFADLGFKYATWMRPSTGYGYTDAQGGRIREGADKVPDSAVWIKYTKNVSVSDCEFSKLGLTALNVTDWVEDVSINGNLIYDISGCGMYVGNHGEGDGANGDEYISKNIEIKNNLVHDYGIDYGSSDGIEGMTMQYATVSNNEIYNGRYSGLVLGYGASGTRYAIDYEYNYIHDILYEDIYDGGAIYVTGNTGGTKERYNHIRYNYCVNQGNSTGVLYPDNRSTFWEIHHNVVDQRRSPLWYQHKAVKGTPARWLFSNGQDNNKAYSNYATTDNYGLSGRFASENVPEVEMGENYYYPDADWPQEAVDIINNSGLTGEYLNKYPSDIQVIDVSDQPITVYKDKPINAFDVLGMTAYGRKGEIKELSRDNVYFSTDTPEFVKVDRDGTITSTGTGLGNIKVEILNDNIIYSHIIKVYSGDEFGSIAFNNSELSLFEDRNFKLEAAASTKLGVALDITSISYTSENEAVATVSPEGEVHSVAEGETNIVAAVECGDIKREITIPVTVKKKVISNVFDVKNYMVTDLTGALRNIDEWTAGGSNDTVTPGENGELIFETPSNNVGYSGQFTDELIHTKIQINASGGWPSISVRAKDKTAAYGANTEYMITFGKNNLSLQKFNNGTRRVFDDAAVECDFEYGREYDLLIGAVNHNDSVEIIVCLDGEACMRYHDYDENRITNQGFIQIYCRAGNIVLKPVD